MIDPSDQFALSVQSISRLNYTAKTAPEKGLRQMAQQFEAVFLQNMLEAMRDTVPKSGLLHSNTTDMYTAMLDRQWAQTLSDRGIGLAEMLVQQLQGRVSGEQTDSADTKHAGNMIAGIPVRQPQQPDSANPVADRSTGSYESPRVPAASADSASAEQPQPLIDMAQNAIPLIRQQVMAATDVARSLQNLPEHVRNFVHKLAPAAREASRKSGLPERLILAQAALESGWGRQEVGGQGMDSTYNVFGIKATGWDGDSVRVATTEYIDGEARPTQAAFRSYDSYQQAFDDYARLLTQSPRYQPVVEAPTAEAAAYQLQVTGYATDPNYAHKLLKVMAQIPRTVNYQAQQSGPSQAEVTQTYSAGSVLRRLF